MIQHVKHVVVCLKIMTLQMHAMQRFEMCTRVATTARLRSMLGGKGLIRKNFAADCLLQKRS